MAILSRSDEFDGDSEWYLLSSYHSGVRLIFSALFLFCWFGLTFS